MQLSGVVEAAKGHWDEDGYINDSVQVRALLRVEGGMQLVGDSCCTSFLGYNDVCTAATHL
jgi:hypothetical protein